MTTDVRRVAPGARRLDHLVYAVPDLDAAVDAVLHLTGIRATAGGQHPGWGTRNALIALGPDMYLEIIGPDSGQPVPNRRGPNQAQLTEPNTGPDCTWVGRPFGIDTLTEPRLATWAARATDLPRLLTDAASAGIVLGPVAGGRRRSPTGQLLQWRFTDPRAVVADGIVPFFIDWGATPHPAPTAAPGARFVGLRASHPDADRVQRMLDSLGLDLPVVRGPRAGLIATIDSPRGRLCLRG